MIRYMKVSIIVPVFNADKYLDKCLNSLTNQTYKDIEIILINDGSTDKSENIINEYKKIDNRIKVIEQKNQGCMISRLNGIKNANGEYCMFVDSDDWIEENTVESLTRMIMLTKADLIKFRFIYEPSKKEQETYIDEKEVLFTGERKRELYYTFMTTARLNNLANQIVKTNLFEINNNDFKKKINQGEDFMINIQLFFKAEKILITNDIYYHYLKNEDSITNNMNTSKIIKNIEDLLYVYNIKRCYLEKFEIDNNKNIVKLMELHTLNGIYNQLYKIMRCKELHKKTLCEIQQMLNEQNFYILIKDIEVKDVKDRNPLKKIMKINIINKKTERNYKYRRIISLYSKIKNGE